MLPKRGLSTTLQTLISRKLTPKRTKLFDFHIARSATMVEFAGWSMPMQYASKGLLASHNWTRTKSSIFDVSHMLQTSITGPDHIEFMESLVVSDLKSLPIGHSTLSLFTNTNGGIIDDTVINKKSLDELYVVSNAGCAEKVLEHLNTHLKAFKSSGGKAYLKEHSTQSLIAIQGPSTVRVIESLINQDLSQFAFMTSKEIMISGMKCYVSRCGYTGEDGFEISVHDDDVVRLCDILMLFTDVEMAGLGARDSLRLEAGLCLYGHDLDESTTPVEAGLMWTIGADIILPQTVKGANVLRRRVGLFVEGAPAREGAEIFFDGVKIGDVTSGCPSPVLKKNIAIGYVENGFHKVGSKVGVKVRGRMQEAVVVKMPFVPASYHKLKSTSTK